MNGEGLKRLLRGVFDTQVMNHGDYNLVYGQPSGTGPALVIGYRARPLELLLCPVEVRRLDGAVSSGHGRQEGRPTTSPPVTSVDLTNVATLADTGYGYQVETVTGFRTWFAVDPVPRVPVGDLAGTTDEGWVELHQVEDAEDFHRLMEHFMDTLEGYYAETGLGHQTEADPA